MDFAALVVDGQGVLTDAGMPELVRRAHELGLATALVSGIAETRAELQVLLGVELTPPYEDAATRATERPDLRGAP